jgi:hypothetical protein
MEPMTIALICAAVFGTVMVISAFVRQILLSRDKKLNDEAQSKAMAQEATELEKIRMQMQNTKRFDAHYQVLGANKDAIKYLDMQIEDLLRKKSELVNRYAKITVKESGEIISSGEVSVERKAACDKLRGSVDSELAFYDSELKLVQEKRSTLWGSHIEFERLLLAQEKSRNASLDSIYKQHSALLEKVYLRHIEDTEVVAVETIKAGTITFKDMLMAPIQFLMQFFGGGVVAAPPTISLVQTRVERASRVEVDRTEREINNPDVDAPAPQHEHSSTQ